MKLPIFILAIISTAHAVIFDCFFTHLTTVNLSSTYSCYQPSLANINESEYLTAVYGQHSIGKSNVDVKGLIIDDIISLTYFPKSIEAFFPNLVAIRIRDTGIRALSGHELDPWVDLFWFKFQHNRNVVRLPPNLFDSTPQLKYIDFYNNNIKHVGEDVFSSLTNITLMDFRYNHCVNQLANNPVQFQALINHLRTNCTDIDDSTTTQSTTISTTEEPSCGNSDEIICNLQVQNEALMAMNLEMKVEINELRIEMGDKLAELSNQNSQLSQENVEIKQKLDEVIAGILELSTRPCNI